MIEPVFSVTRFRMIKIMLWLVCLLPAVFLAWDFFHDGLGANPLEALTRRLGEWALRFLLLTLSMTPLRKMLQQVWPIRLRRMLGLYTFFYATLHLLCYLWFDQFFAWREIAEDITKRPFITAGMAGWLLMVPLAVTSSRKMIRRLGRHWKTLHQMIYIISILVVSHYFLLVKADIQAPLVYALFLMVILGYRLYKRVVYMHQRLKNRYCNAATGG